eukprot:TRINITY_DN1732_c0_g1_i1.p1 TRINITY_DN1732_c0_g1~~TRINITY_DN1732_c0_g1_i1.p1  ORF type:complete len:217 (-),score=21.51 TRINITY_DN1732_c0_g1_i1:47-697(-)
MPKRDGYLRWDEYFMGVAILSAQRSKDPNRQVGACVVNAENKIVGIGYNGFPIGCNDDALPWNGKEVLNGRKHDASAILETKYPYVCHAELNAVLNCNSLSLKGCVMYVTLFPCNECAKLLIQSGICKVVYLSDKNHDDPLWVASRRMLDLSGVRYVPFKSPLTSLQIEFASSKATMTHTNQAKEPRSQRVQPRIVPLFCVAFIAGFVCGLFPRRK